MRSYLIDEIILQDMEKIEQYLGVNAIRSRMESLFWVQLPEELLTDTQCRHVDCRPHVFALEMGEDWIKLEFLIRTLKNMGCTCGGYSTDRQRAFIIQYADKIMGDLHIRT